jgi:phosphoketolase
VLPILHLNQVKSANPTIFGSMNDQELRSLFVGYGTYHSHQVPAKDVKSNLDHLRVLEQ